MPLCHQIVLALFYAAQWTTRAPFSFEPTKPFGVPQLLSLSFWGGLWGIILGLILNRVRSERAFWLIALVFGAIAPTLVAGFVVAPLKGLPAGGGGKLAVIGLSVTQRGVWGRPRSIGRSVESSTSTVAGPFGRRERCPAARDRSPQSRATFPCGEGVEPLSRRRRSPAARAMMSSSEDHLPAAAGELEAIPE